ncbi:MAG: glycosyltransferase [Bacteroidaceae bacterium]
MDKNRFTIHEMTKLNDIKVSVLCTAYNHAPYLKQCLDGFVMQKTNFRFEVIINDDASTDDSASIIAQYEANYPDLIKPIYQKVNQYSQKIDLYQTILFPKMKGQYVAICEGDDYWTDPYKLQKQVDILDAEKECVLVYTNFNTYQQESKELKPFKFVFKEGAVHNELLASKCTIQTLTIMFRCECLKGMPTLDPNVYFLGDLLWYCWLTQLGNVRAIPEPTAVYRKLKNSASHFTDIKHKIKLFYLCSNTRLYFLNKEDPQKRSPYGPRIRKKAAIWQFRYSLVTDDFDLYQRIKMPFSPILTFNKLKYYFLFKRCHSELVFHKEALRYSQFRK